MNPEELERLTKLEELVGFVEQHAKDAALQVGRLDHLITDLLDRLVRVERKTAPLSDAPGRKNCPHCNRVVNNPTAKVCPICGHALYS